MKILFFIIYQKDFLSSWVAFHWWFTLTNNAPYQKLKNIQCWWPTSASDLSYTVWIYISINKIVIINAIKWFQTNYSQNFPAISSKPYIYTQLSEEIPRIKSPHKQYPARTNTTNRIKSVQNLTFINLSYILDQKRQNFTYIADHKMELPQTHIKHEAGAKFLL